MGGRANSTPSLQGEGTPGSSLVQPFIAVKIPGELAWFAFSVLLGIVCAWAGRYSMNPDGISYLDLGDYYLRADWSNVANAYWSPMYPWLLGIAMRVLKPSAWWQFPLVHGVNFLVFLWALLCFRYFVCSLLLEQRREQAALTEQHLRPLSEWALWATAYALFLWSSLVLIGLSIVTPDLLLSAWIYVAAGLVVHLRNEHSYTKFFALGLVLGAGYLTKSVMFPLAFTFLVITLFSGNSVRCRAPRVLLATIVFLLVSSPLILLLSYAKGRFTFGDSGRLTYAWLVSPGAALINAQSDPASFLLHPTNKILEHPAIYEFAQPIGGTFPPWFDPSYWNDGLRPHFSFRSQVRALVESLTTYTKLLVTQSGWLAGTLILVLMGGRATIRGIYRKWPLIIISIASLALYALVLARSRYAAAFIVVLCLSVLAGILLPQQERVEEFTRYVSMATVAAMMFSIGQPLLEKAYLGPQAGTPWTNQESMRAAIALEQLGLRPGDQVAIIGPGLTDFWARLGGVKIVAQIMPEDGENEFRNSWPERKTLVYSTMARTGARALIAWAPSGTALAPGWQQVPGTRYRVYFLGKRVSPHNG